MSSLDFSLCPEPSRAPGTYSKVLTEMNGGGLSSIGLFCLAYLPRKKMPSFATQTLSLEFGPCSGNTAQWLGPSDRTVLKPSRMETRGSSPLCSSHQCTFKALIQSTVLSLRGAFSFLSPFLSFFFSLLPSLPFFFYSFHFMKTLLYL